MTMPEAKPVYEFRKIVTPIKRIKIKGEWREQGGNTFYVCLDCNHWHERVMEGHTVNGYIATCQCGCHDLNYSEITQEKSE